MIYKRFRHPQRQIWQSPGLIANVDKRYAFRNVQLWHLFTEHFTVVNKARFCGIFAIGLAASILGASVAGAATYTTSGAPTQTSLGDTLQSGYDVLTIGGVTGTLVDGGSIVLNTLSFTAGVNAYAPANYTGYSFSETLTVGSGTQQLTIPFSLGISYSDTLTIIGGQTLSFLDNGSLWQIVVNGLTMGPNAGGTMYANLTASVTDPPGVSQAPLPAALPLFASGLGAMGLFSLWRRRKIAASNPKAC